MSLAGKSKVGIEMRNIEIQTRLTFHSATNFAKRFARDETGSVAVEYAMVAAGIGVAVAGAVVILGQAVSDVFFDPIQDAVKGS